MWGLSWVGMMADECKLWIYGDIRKSNGVRECTYGEDRIDISRERIGGQCGASFERAGLQGKAGHARPNSRSSTHQIRTPL